MKQLMPGVAFGAFFALAMGLAQAPKPDDGRFDGRVRGDFFAGYAGDRARLERGMKTCENALDHRSTMVNIDAIRELRPCFHGDYEVVLRDGTELRLSHRFRGNLEKDFLGAL